MFTYIKPEFMIHAFCQQRDTALVDRSICVARLGDFAIMMEKVNDDAFSLSLENVVNGSLYAGKIFNVKNLSAQDISPVVEELFKHMQTIHEKENFDNRETIWKWYAMNWLEDKDISLDEYIETRMTHGQGDECPHWKNFEDYMNQDYLNVSTTMNIIDKYAENEDEKTRLKNFAAKDIVELRQRHSLEAMQEEFASKEEVIDERKLYGFSIEVAASSRAEAREKLEKLLKDEPKGDFIIRG